jgi:hypothetical protein
LNRRDFLLSGIVFARSVFPNATVAPLIAGLFIGARRWLAVTLRSESKAEEAAMELLIENMKIGWSEIPLDSFEGEIAPGVFEDIGKLVIEK